ncbi:MAG: M23 family metallopeptidase [Candidatus Cloacimonetes bacterium]|nr:M23 family metallopeptidase [Candidatus Cloacimonadota bacterium]
MIIRFTKYIVIFIILMSINQVIHTQDLLAPFRVFTPDWWGVSQDDYNLYFYGRGESSDRDLAEELARGSTYEALVFFINGWVEAWLNSGDTWHEIDNVVSRQSISDEYLEIVGTASIRDSHFSRRETYVLSSGLYESFFQLSMDKNLLKSIIEDTVYEIESFRADEITSQIREAVEKMVEISIEVAILDYEEVIPMIVETPSVPIASLKPELPIVTAVANQQSYRAPLNNPVVTSEFGMRFHPIYRVNKPHRGIDLRAATGTPILAIQDGIVIRSRYQSDYGEVIEIQHANNESSLYAHLSRRNVVNRQRVNQGDVIGLTGSTGISQGPHLHFEIRVNGLQVNPRSKIMF